MVLSDPLRVALLGKTIGMSIQYYLHGHHRQAMEYLFISRH